MLILRKISRRYILKYNLKYIKLNKVIIIVCDIYLESPFFRRRTDRIIILIIFFFRNFKFSKIKMN